MAREASRRPPVPPLRQQGAAEKQPLGRLRNLTQGLVLGLPEEEDVCIGPPRSPPWGGAGDPALCINVTQDKGWERGMDAQLREARLLQTPAGSFLHLTSALRATRAPGLCLALGTQRRKRRSPAFSALSPLRETCSVEREKSHVQRRGGPTWPGWGGAGEGIGGELTSVSRDG